MSSESLNLFKKWIKSAKNIKQRFEFLAENPIMSDFKFIIGPEKIEVPAHKYIFAATSFEFFNLFFLSAPTDNDINLEEISYESFKEFIRYVYSDDIKIVSENFFDILTLSLRFDMEHLKNLCLKELPTIIEDNSNVKFNKFFMEYFEVWNMEKVSDVFLKIIGRRPLDFINEENVEKLKLEHISVILKSEETETQEIDYFKLAMMWAERQWTLMKIVPTPAKNRLVLENLFFQIRFLTMTLDEFQKCSADQNGLFTNEEMFQIILFLNSNGGSGSSTNLEFCLNRRVLRLKQRTGVVEYKNISKLMLSHDTPERRTYCDNIYQYTQQQTSAVSFYVRKSLILNGINILFNRHIMECWQTNIRHLSCELYIKNKQEILVHSHMFKFDIPKNFSKDYLEETVLFEKNLKLKASEDEYLIELRVNCSEKENPFLSQACPFLYNTPLEEIIAANRDICEFKGQHATAISNLIFSLDEIKIQINRLDGTGRTFNVEIYPFDTTDMLKDAIYKAEKIPRNQMVILFNENILEDSERLHKYEIVDNSVLNLEIHD